MGEHLLGQQPSWWTGRCRPRRWTALSRIAPTSRISPGSIPRHRRLPSGGVVRRSRVRPPGRSAISTRRAMRDRRQLPARSSARPDQPITIKAGRSCSGPWTANADSRSFDITNRNLSLADRGALARADLRRALRPGRAASSLFISSVRRTVRRQGPAERGLRPGGDAASATGCGSSAGRGWSTGSWI